MPETTPDTQIGSDGERYPTGTQPTADPGGPIPPFGDASGATNGQTLVYDASAGEWVPGAASGGSATLTGLTDTEITAAAKGDLLVFDGTNWVDVTVGANDTILTADSAETSGVKWAAAAASASYDSFATVLAEIRALGSIIHDYDFGVASGNITDTVGSQDLVVAAGGGSITYAQADPTGGTDAVLFNVGAKSEVAAIGDYPVGDANRTLIAIVKSTVPSGTESEIFGYGTHSADDAFIYKQKPSAGNPTWPTFVGWGSSADFSLGSEHPLNGEWNVLALQHNTTTALNTIHCNETFGAKGRTLTTGSANELPSIPYDTGVPSLYVSHFLAFDDDIGTDLINRLALGLKLLKYGA